MAMQFIAHHRFQYFTEDPRGKKWKERMRYFADWLLLVSVAGFTVFLVVSFLAL